MRELLSLIIAELERGGTCCLCQVIDTKGSSPRKAGAAMIVYSDGRLAGTIGGGIVEAQVQGAAVALLESAGDMSVKIRSFALDDPEAGPHDRPICGGSMTVGFQRFEGPSPLPYFQAYQSLIEDNRGMMEVIAKDGFLYNVPEGARGLFNSKGRLAIAWPVPGNLAWLNGAVECKLRDRNLLGGPPFSVAFLPIWPRIRLVIVGAGHVGQAVAEFAARVDFDVIVVDDRPEFASPERFPTASKRIVCAFCAILDRLDITEQTYVLIVTRGHRHDQEVLGYVAASAAPYVGMIGSQRKVKMTFDALRASGVPEPALARVAAPVGLDIGSESVPEIAVSIVAELVACRNKGLAAPFDRPWKQAAPVTSLASEEASS